MRTGPPRIYHLSDATELRAFLDFINQERDSGTSIVATNGCFDIYHSGHARFLHESAKEGQMLIVGLNDDDGVRKLKGNSRPINQENDRATVVAYHACVEAVAIFPGTKATLFLQYVRPRVYVKSGYTVDQLDPDEQQAVVSGGGVTKILPLHEGYSTTKIIAKINA